MAQARIKPEEIVEAPPWQPSWHGLLATATVIEPVDNAWEAGYVFEPAGLEVAGTGNLSTRGTATEVQTWSPSDTAGEPTALTDPDALEVITRPVRHEIGMIRTTFGLEVAAYPAAVRQFLDNGTSKAVEREFWLGLKNPDNQRLRTGTALAGPVAPKRALSILEGALSGMPNGGRGVIHAPTELVSLWTSDSGALTREGSRLVTTANGHFVVAGDGYPATGATGPIGNPDASPSGGVVWVYATGLCTVRLGPIVIDAETIGEALNRDNNKTGYRASRAAAVNFDPQRGPVAVLVNLAA